MQSLSCIIKNPFYALYYIRMSRQCTGQELLPSLPIIFLEPEGEWGEGERDREREREDGGGGGWESEELGEEEKDNMVRRGRGRGRRWYIVTCTYLKDCSRRLYA